MTAPSLTLELETDRVVRDGQVIELTRMEARLLAYLWSRPGQPVSEAELLTEVWGYSATSSRTVKTTVSRLRRKLEPDPRAPRWLRTVPGQGYLLAVRAPVRALPSLPAVGPFIDRPALVDRARTALEQGAVALVGPGGAGKTRLAVALAAESPHPAGFVGLASAGTVDDAVLAVAAALDLAVTGDPVDAVGARLADMGPCRLVLDNLEQLPTELGVVLERWRERAPALELIWTTRRPFPMEGSVRVEVGPMEPDEARALFQLGARSQADPVDVDDAAAERVADRLARLPLAVELAASWLDVLTADDIHARLEREGTAALDELGAAVDASWVLLAPSDRNLLAQIAAFSASFRATQAEAVLEPERGSVLGGLRALRQASLLQRAPDGRFSVLVPIRERVAVRLPGPLAAARTRWVRWAGVRARNHAEALVTADFEGAWGWFASERDLLLGAHDAALAGPDPESAASLALALARVAEIRGSTEARGRVERTLALEGLGPVDRAALTGALARTLGHGGSAEAASQAAQDALARSADWPVLHLQAWHDHRALRLIGGSLVLEDPPVPVEGPPWLLARVHGLQAQILRHRGQPEAAEEAFREALEHAEASGSPPWRVRALAAFGEHLHETGRFEEGRALLDRAVALGEAHKLGTATARATMQRGNAALLEGRAEAARRDLAQAVRIQRRTGGIRPLINILLRQGHTEANLGHLDEAHAACEEGLQLALRAGAAQMAFLFSLNLAIVALDRGEPARALERMDAMEVEGPGWELNHACVLFHRAWALAALGRREDAATANGRSQVLYADRAPFAAAECDALQACIDPTDREALDRAREGISGMERGVLGAVRVLQQRQGDPTVAVPDHVRREAEGTAFGRQVLRWLDGQGAP